MLTIVLYQYFPPLLLYSLVYELLKELFFKFLDNYLMLEKKA